jgi:hypothetical protein
MDPPRKETVVSSPASAAITIWGLLHDFVGGPMGAVQELIFVAAARIHLAPTCKLT